MFAPEASSWYLGSLRGTHSPWGGLVGGSSWVLEGTGVGGDQLRSRENCTEGSARQ